MELNLKEELRKLLKSFRIPSSPDWGYAFFLLSVASAICYGFRVMFTNTGWGWPMTSLGGFAVFMPAVILTTLLIPTVILSSGSSEKIIGKYTGIGPLLTGLFSGIGLMLIYTALHNLTVMFMTSRRIDMIFPAYFYRTELDSAPVTLYEILSDTVIPGIGIVLFFGGLVWSSFKITERTMGYVIVGLIFATYNLNLIDFPALFMMGAWLAFVRTKSRNIWAPFASLLGMRLTQLFFGEYLESLDITTIQTYSDIEMTYFYSSLPALFMGIVLMFFFMRLLSDFYNSYSIGLHSNLVMIPEADDDDTGRRSIVEGIRPPLIVAVIIWVVLWGLVIEGAHI